jgi:hypothetical protein
MQIDRILVIYREQVSYLDLKQTLILKILKAIQLYNWYKTY